MTKCFALIRGRAMRVTRLDGCGNPVPGANSVVASDGFISVAFTANTETGEAISIPNAAGKICIQDTPAPVFTGYSLAISLCGVDPNLVNLLTGQALVYDGSEDPEAIGFRINSKVDLDETAFALELWSGVPSAVCEPGQGVSYGYVLVPFIKGGVLGDFTVENGAVNFSISGANSKDGNGWGVGPFDVVLDGTDAPSPLLTPLDPNDHLNVELTQVAPPEPGCGGIPLGEPATTITAGIPATLTPSGSYAPATLADLIADDPTASPLTAWTTGQYVLLEDGTHAHWDSTDWVAGDAP